MKNRSKKKSRKKPITPVSHIKNVLRGLWLRSRERAKALRDAHYTCKCGAKQSRAKGKEVYIEVHHIDMINWKGLAELIRERLLSGELQVLCKQCHKEEHKDETM